MLGPALLMFGLTQTGGAAASLLLNVEGVLTAVIAWLVFKENADRQIVLGMVAIVVGGVLLSWEPGGATFSTGALFILGACLCWAIDNNLTRKVSTNDAMLVAGLKGLVAGTCNTALAFIAGAPMPAPSAVGSSLVVGFFGYGLSLTLFVVGLRVLGTARTGAYFSVAPLFGVVLSLAIWPSVPGPLFWVATASMALGVWLHVRERHVHEHTHEHMEHSHQHRHDEHHQHEHTFAWSGEEPHAHVHRHEVLTHRHPHYPDIHHRHSHSRSHQANRAEVFDGDGEWIHRNDGDVTCDQQTEVRDHPIAKAAVHPTIGTGSTNTAHGTGFSAISSTPIRRS